MYITYVQHWGDFESRITWGSNSKLEEIVEELCKKQPKWKSGLQRIFDTNSDKALIAKKTREMDEAFQAYTVRIIDLV